MRRSDANRVDDDGKTARIAHDAHHAQRAKEHETRGQNAKRGQNGGKVDECGYRERVFHESFPIASAVFFYVMGDPTQQVVEEQDVHRDKIERGERELPSAGSRSTWNMSGTMLANATATRNMS